MTKYSPNISGLKFGMLTAKNPIKLNGIKVWECVCDCGSTKNVRYNHLVNGSVSSCGCRWHLGNSEHNKWKGVGELSLTKYNAIREGAIIRGIDFDDDLTIEHLWELYIKQNKKCAISGLDIKFGVRSKDSKGTASLDRINSEIGYTVDNVQWVHKTINMMKNKMGEDKFIDMCRSVYNNNLSNDTYELYIGRFQPPHLGHMTIFNQSLDKGQKVCIAIRNIEPDEKNPLEPTTVQSIWRKMYDDNPNVEVIIIPDICSIKYGRTVGYKIEEIIVDREIAAISATQIRESIKIGDNKWRDFVHPKIQDYIAQIFIENEISNM